MKLIWLEKKACDEGALEGKEEYRSRGETQMCLAVGPPRWEQLGLEPLKRRVISSCPKGELLKKKRRKIKDPLAKSRRRRRKRRTVMQVESEETRGLCHSTRVG